MRRLFPYLVIAFSALMLSACNDSASENGFLNLGYDDALAEAKKSDKIVMLDFGGPG